MLSHIKLPTVDEVLDSFTPEEIISLAGFDPQSPGSVRLSREIADSKRIRALPFGVDESEGDM